MYSVFGFNPSKFRVNLSLFQVNLIFSSLKVTPDIVDFGAENNSNTISAVDEVVVIVVPFTSTAGTAGVDIFAYLDNVCSLLSLSLQIKSNLYTTSLFGSKFVNLKRLPSNFTSTAGFASGFLNSILKNLPFISSINNGISAFLASRVVASKSVTLNIALPINSGPVVLSCVSSGNWVNTNGAWLPIFKWVILFILFKTCLVTRSLPSKSI